MKSRICKTHWLRKFAERRNDKFQKARRIQLGVAVGIRANCILRYAMECCFRHGENGVLNINVSHLGKYSVQNKRFIR